MRTILAPLTCTLALLLVVGCASTNRSLLTVPTQANRAYDFVVESDPPGADVFWRSPDGEKNLGKTPLTLPLGLAEQREELFLGLTRHKAWHPFIATGLPITFQEQGETVSVSVRELRLVLRGYEPETFARDWQFASDLTQRDSPEGRRQSLHALWRP
jgi:hypothetical protein